jgi:hypothetical protein
MLRHPRHRDPIGAEAQLSDLQVINLHWPFGPIMSRALYQNADERLFVGPYSKAAEALRSLTALPRRPNDAERWERWTASSGLSDPEWNCCERPRSDLKSIRLRALAFSTFFGDGTTRASNRPIMHGWTASTPCDFLRRWSPQGQNLAHQWTALGLTR